eukprot:11185715-Lingulodinium_polyedra.AAC.1
MKQVVTRLRPSGARAPAARSGPCVITGTCADVIGRLAMQSIEHQTSSRYTINLRLYKQSLHDQTMGKNWQE